MPVRSPDGSFQPLNKPKRHRLPRYRFRDSPVGKRMRVIDPEALERARRFPYCVLCGVPGNGKLHPHHATTKGAGGDDVDANLCPCCPSCHRAVHDGHISREQVKAAIRRCRRPAAPA